MARILARLEGLRARTARTAIHGALRLCAAEVAADFAMSQIIVRRFFGSEPLLESDRASVERFGAWFAERIQRGVDRGELRADLDVGTMISLVMAVLSSTVLEWVSSERQFDLPAALAVKIDCLFDGARARP